MNKQPFQFKDDMLIKKWQERRLAGGRVAVVHPAIASWIQSTPRARERAHPSHKGL